VHDFAVSPDEVKLDRGFSPKIADMVNGKSRTEQEKVDGRKVAKALAGKLLEEIRALGLPAERAAGVQGSWIHGVYRTDESPPRNRCTQKESP